VHTCIFASGVCVICIQNICICVICIQYQCKSLRDARQRLPAEYNHNCKSHIKQNILCTRSIERRNAETTRRVDVDM